MTHDDVRSWLDRYVAAWQANERGPIEELFAEDAVYRFHPYDEGDRVTRGREAIVSAWLESPDEPDAWDARYETHVVEGDRAVATGTSRYLARGEEPERVYHNCFLLRFDSEGRCSEFTEYYVRVPR